MDTSWLLRSPYIDSASQNIHNLLHWLEHLVLSEETNSVSLLEALMGKIQHLII
ncbi:9752_t:CDS:2 [Rhizophagus irregularis]|nr:9752_t:CDS:2 [Rhizophagus irregularis]